MLETFWNNKEVLITGGTGSLGKVLTKKLLEKSPKGIRIYSRDELKQWEMKQEIEKINTKIPISYLIGDVRDRKRLELATKNVDIIIHTAALKQVPSSEKNPLEVIKTNVMGAQNVLYAALENKIKKVIAISTDKACYPVNLYGATKLCAEKLFMAGNVYSGDRYPKISCIRYGNVLGSRGSIVPLFKKQHEETGRVTITDPSMTRFWITLNQVVGFILASIERMTGGEIFIPKMGSAGVMTILEAVIPAKCEISTIGIRPGEKLNEILVNKEESLNTIEHDDYFVITNKVVSSAFEYRSDTNKNQLNYRQIRKMLKDG